MDSKIIKIIFFIFLTSINVNAVEFSGKFRQGHFIIGKTLPNAQIFIDKKKIKVSKEGYFAFGISKDRKYDVTIVEKIDDHSNTFIKKVIGRKYKIQRIDGLLKKVTPQRIFERINNENKLVEKQKNRY